MSITTDKPKSPRARKPKPEPKAGDDLTLLTAMQRFATDDLAREYLEAQRWPHGPYCPHCGNGDKKRIAKIPAHAEAKVRPGLRRCNECGKQFTVTVGTIFEDSHIPLSKWMIAFYRMASSKTQVSALQLQRELQLGSYRTAWFMCHRIRFAMTDTDPTNGGTSKLDGTVEVDETYVGGLEKNKHASKRLNVGGGSGGKTPVVALIQRDGNVRTEVVPEVTKDSIGVLLRRHVAKTAVLNTDESNVYPEAASYFVGHDTVNHKREQYSRKDKKTGRRASTNRAEGFFSGAKRSIDGTHHHVEPEYLSLYMNEIVFKYNARDVSDGARTIAALGKVEGKRLSLRPMKSKSAAPEMP